MNGGKRPNHPYAGRAPEVKAVAEIERCGSGCPFKGFSVDQKTFGEYRRTRLMWAAWYGELDRLCTTLPQSATETIRDVENVRLLLNHTPEESSTLNISTHIRNSTPLGQAIAATSLEAVKGLFEKGADIDLATGPESFTLLYECMNNYFLRRRFEKYGAEQMLLFLGSNAPVYNFQKSPATAIFGIYDLNPAENSESPRFRYNLASDGPTPATARVRAI